MKTTAFEQELIDLIRDVIGGTPDRQGVEDITSFVENEIHTATIPPAVNGPHDSDTDGSKPEPADDSLYAVLDMRAMTARPKRKWYRTDVAIGTRRGRSRLSKKRGLCFHHTAVTRGFGSHKSMARAYAKELKARSGRVFIAEVLRTNHDLTAEQWIEAQALGGRYRGDGPKGRHNQGVPYHVVRGSNSVLYLNLPFEWVTWHGNGSNTDFLGFAWDADSRVDSLDVEDIKEDVRYTVNLARMEGHPIQEFTAHCAWTNKPSDPGPEFIEQVIIPLADELDCTVDLEFKIDKPGARSLSEVLRR